MKQTILRLMIANGTALIVFYLMYRWGVNNIEGIKEYYYIPLTVLIGYLAISERKEFKIERNS